MKQITWHSTKTEVVTDFEGVVVRDAQGEMVRTNPWKFCRQLLNERAFGEGLLGLIESTELALKVKRAVDTAEKVQLPTLLLEDAEAAALQRAAKAVQLHPVMASNVLPYLTAIRDAAEPSKKDKS